MLVNKLPIEELAMPDDATERLQKADIALATALTAVISNKSDDPHIFSLEKTSDPLMGESHL